MGVIDRIKSALGLGTSDRAVTSDTGGRSRSGDVDVTVEHEPATESEDAVKGTDTASGDTSADAGAAESGLGDETGTETGPDSETDDGGAAPGGGTDADLEGIKGIGPAYAGRLREAGVESVADLADADPEELDAETGIGPNRLANWIDRAQER